MCQVRCKVGCPKDGKPTTTAKSGYFFFGGGGGGLNILGTCPSALLFLVTSVRLGVFGLSNLLIKI